MTLMHLFCGLGPPIKNTGYTYDLLPSAIHHIVNFSLSRDYFLDILKKA